MESIKNKVAFITGGSRGIGQAIVRKLSAEGAHVAFTYTHSESIAKNLAKELSTKEVQVMAIKADSGDPASIASAIQETVSEFNKIDILVNNAGNSFMTPIEEVSIAEFDKLVAVNIRGVFVAIQSAIQFMPKGGRIINIGSAAGERSIFPGGTIYAMSKAAIGGLTRGLARDLGPKGITVNNVQPGPIDTDMNPATSSYAHILRGYVALGHYGTVTDIAELVAFLASPSAQFITGASVNIDGGLVS